MTELELRGETDAATPFLMESSYPLEAEAALQGAPNTDETVDRK